MSGNGRIIYIAGAGIAGLTLALALGKFGARVVYAAADLRAWADSHTYGMTSDPGYVQRDSVR